MCSVRIQNYTYMLPNNNNNTSSRHNITSNIRLYSGRYMLLQCLSRYWSIFFNLKISKSIFNAFKLKGVSQRWMWATKTGDYHSSVQDIEVIAKFSLSVHLWVKKFHVEITKKKQWKQINLQCVKNNP